MVQVGKPRRAFQQPPMFGGAFYVQADKSIRQKNQIALMSAADKRFPFVSRTCPHVFSGVLRASDVARIAKSIIANHWALGERVKLEQLGLSSNNQPIWAIQVLPSGQGAQNGTAIFYAGNHNPEYAGPHAVLNLLDLILGELKDPQTAVSQMLGNKALVFVPLANPDGAIFEADGSFAALDYMGPRVDREGCCKDTVTYHPYYEAKLRPETAIIKQYLEGLIGQFGSPVLSIDFHETPHCTLGEARKNRFVFAPMEVTLAEEQVTEGKTIGIRSTCAILRPVIDQVIEIFGKDVSDLIFFGRPKNEFSRQLQDFLSFSDWTKTQGARSFIIETPQSLNGFHVGDRVFMAMLAVQAIFGQLQ